MKDRVIGFCKFSAGVALIGILSACAAPNSNGTQPVHGPKQTTGAIIGGIAGGLLGNEVADDNKALGTGIGVLVGAWAGSSIGGGLDRIDRMYVESTSQKALETAPSNQTVPWKNPDSGNYGSVTPKSTYQENGRYCREFQQRVVIDGKSQSAYGTACRQADGSWKITS